MMQLLVGKSAQVENVMNRVSMNVTNVDLIIGGYVRIVLSGVVP